LATTAAAYPAQQISVFEQRTLAASELPQPKDASHGLVLQVVSFHGTRWKTERIVSAIRQAAPLLGACGVALDRVEIRVLDALRPLHFYSTVLSRALLRTIDVPRPAIFFVEDTRNNPAFDAEAVGRENASTRPELADTVWIAYGSRDLAHVIAHELVHVLSDSGVHSDEAGNLMRGETSAGSERLSPAQCAKLRATGEANGLLFRKQSLPNGA
jgi:hypothetical protein